MTITFCNRIEIIPISDIQKMDPERIELFPGKKFTSLQLEEKVNYSFQVQPTDAGILINETVSVKIRYSDALPLHRHYILKMYTDRNSFVVGTKEYPAEMNLTTDKIFVNLTFKASKPKL